MQQMRRAVIERGGLAARAVDVTLELVPDPDRAALELPQVRVRGAALLGVRDDEMRAHCGEVADIPDLPAGLSVERGAIEDDLARYPPSAAPRPDHRP